MAIGERIKIQRERLGISATELAAMIDMNRSTIFRYESSDVSSISFDKIKPIADALGVSPLYLVGWSDDPFAGMHQAGELSSIIPVAGMVKLEHDITVVLPKNDEFDIIHQTHTDVCIDVSGDCLSGIMIYDGDKIFVRRHDISKVSGRFYVVHLIEEKVTAFKRVFWQDDHIILVPVSGDRIPLIKPLSTVKILGECVGAYRYL